MHSVAGGGMTRGQFLPRGAAQQETPGTPSAVATAPATAAASEKPRGIRRIPADSRMPWALD